MNMEATRLVRRCLLLACAMLPAACATTMGTPPEEVVGKRAQARWDALLAEDIDTAYDYLSPGYRSGHSKLDYMRKLASMRVRWTGAEVKRSECSDSSCKVWIFVDYNIFGALPGVMEFKDTSEVEEDWILSDGEWFLLPRK